MRRKWNETTNREVECFACSLSANPTRFPFHQTPGDLVEWKMASRIRQAGRLCGVKEKPAPDVFLEDVCFVSTNSIKKAPPSRLPSPERSRRRSICLARDDSIESPRPGSTCLYWIQVETKNLIFLTVRFHENVHFIGFSSFVSSFHGIGRETGNEVQGFTQHAYTRAHLRCALGYIDFADGASVRVSSRRLLRNLSVSNKKSPTLPVTLPLKGAGAGLSVLPGMIPLNRPGWDQPAYIGLKWKRKTSFFRRSFTSKCFILLGFCVRLLVYPPIPCKRETKLKVLHNKRILPPLLREPAFLYRPGCQL
jgi:hypothetical protein